MDEEKTANVPQEEQHQRHSAVIVRGIAMPAHQVRDAIRQAVARGQVSEEDGEEVFWLYSYAQEYKLKERDLAEKMQSYDQNTIYQVFRGVYGVQKDGKFSSWANFIKAVKLFKRAALEERNRKDIGIIDTAVKRTVWKCCDAALTDNWPVFIYGRTQIGKTTALMEYQRLHNHGRTTYIRLGAGWSKVRFVRELAAKLGNGTRAARMWTLEDAILRTFTRFSLLIVDEFHLAFTTLGKEQTAALVEFIREIHDRTGCGIVMCATKVGLLKIENGDNRLTFEQFTMRGVVKTVLPDLPSTKDLNTVAAAFDLPAPTGQTLRDLKAIVKAKTLGPVVKYLQKAYGLAKKRGEELSWEMFFAVADGYMALAAMNTEEY